MKTLFTFALAAMVTASQASALSCMQPDVAQTFQRVDAAQEIYIVVRGAFDFTPPADDGENSQQAIAAFSGQILGQGGFRNTASFPVQLVTACAGPWCGSFPSPGQDVIAFVEQTPAGYVLSLEPCGGTLFQRPRAEEVARLEACMRGERCSPAPTR